MCVCVCVSLQSDFLSELVYLRVFVHRDYLAADEEDDDDGRVIKVSTMIILFYIPMKISFMDMAMRVLDRAASPANSRDI